MLDKKILSILTGIPNYILPLKKGSLDDITTSTHISSEIISCTNNYVVQHYLFNTLVCYFAAKIKIAAHFYLKKVSM